MGDESDLTPLEDEVAVPKKLLRTRRKKAAPESEQMTGEEGHAKRSKPTRKRTTSQALENTVTGSEVHPKKRRRAGKPEPVYIIADVEKKATTFRGRLGTDHL